MDDLPAAADLPLESDSPLVRNPEPWGPGSFWYPGASGRLCVYAPGALGPCYRIVGPGRPSLDPTAIAGSIADRLLLLPGRVQTSPRVVGLTGAVAWFWLEPAPESEELTVSIFGETVTVLAEPVRVAWWFGDGSGVAAGPGRPYRAGPRPAGAILHAYETRCLPGDQGRNPYVLGSCASEGYRVDAVISWRISFVATGPIDTSGTLPTRTTAASTPYSVSEARAFLVPGASR